MKISQSFLLLVAVFIFGCTPKINETVTNNTASNAVVTEERNLEELVITAPKEFTLPTYNPSHLRANDLLHTKLAVSFDFEKQHVFGEATLTLTPFFYPTETLVLDAKGFDLHRIALAEGKELKYAYDGELITIQLDRLYKKGEKYTVSIKYTAKPNERKIGGSDAITQDKGLYFINPKGEEPNKPTQIWTQGETESNSCWFPTIDKPNERCTQEIAVTIRNDFKTLSNGVLQSSTDNKNGTRTDLWVMDMPHAPYLFMLAIGDFEIVKDTWRGKDVTYYLEKKYAPYARRIFPYTLEMLDFYSETFGYDYPWQKYAQVVVRDYVSGAMENTTGVIFGDFMHGTERELIDELNNERIVAHELVHHWFGDLVTCESWANLPLNESFANYGEYLWMEKKHGKQAADYHLMNELNGYLNQARSNTHDLIYFDYKDKEQTFDAHSYNKGGAILHSLRNYLGDEAFFAALKYYLKTNEFTAVEAHDLRIAFEDVTGKDLNWFFNQWFFASGHPNLVIKQAYNDSTNRVQITVLQTQDPEQNVPIYQLPLAIDVYDAKGKTRHKVMINQRKQVFEFSATDLKLVDVDADRILVGTQKHEKSVAENIFQYQNATSFRSRFDALAALEANKTEPEVAALFNAALKDAHWYLRAKALKSATDLNTIAVMAEKDAHSAVRAEAVRALADTKKTEYVPIFKNIVSNEQAYPVIATAMGALAATEPATALQYADNLVKEENSAMKIAVANVYAITKSTDKLDFFVNNFYKIDGFQANAFMKNYDDLLAATDLNTQLAAVPPLKDFAMDSRASLWQRYSATRSLKNRRDFFLAKSKDDNEPNKLAYAENLETVTNALVEAINAEQNPQLAGIYKNWLPK